MRTGHTLVEVVVSVSATSILLAGMGSAVFVAARASDPAALPSNTIQGSMTAQEIAAEMRTAISFAEYTATAVEFTRDNGGATDTIRYAWSGTPGDPITRQKNGGNVVAVCNNVHRLNLTYHTTTTTETLTRYYLSRTAIAIQVGDNPASQVNTAVQILNAPEVAAP